MSSNNKLLLLILLLIDGCFCSRDLEVYVFADKRIVARPLKRGLASIWGGFTNFFSIGPWEFPQTGGDDDNDSSDCDGGLPTSPPTSKPTFAPTTMPTNAPTSLPTGTTKPPTVYVTSAPIGTRSPVTLAPTGTKPPTSVPTITPTSSPAVPSSCLNESTPFFADTDVDKTEIGLVYGMAYNNRTGVNESLLMDKYEVPFAPQVARPVAVIVHGGHCRGGTRVGGRQEILARKFAQRGFVSVSIDYRLMSELDSCRSPGAIEAAGSDAKAAIRYIQARADEWGINKTQILVAGCSAGARTSMWAAFAEGNGIDSTFPAFMQASDQNWISDNDPDQDARVQAVIEVSGDLYAPNEPPPIIDSDDPPVLILHGTADMNFYTPIEEAYKIEASASAAGVYSDLVVYEGGGHCPWDFIDPEMDRLYAFAHHHLDIDCSLLA